MGNRQWAMGNNQWTMDNGHPETSGGNGQ